VFRSRTPRAVVAALTAVVLIVGLMASTTSAAPKPKPSPTPTPTPTPTPLPTPTPTPTPNSDNRIVYFGDPATDPDGDGVLNPTDVTTGGVYLVSVLGRNDGNQNLTHTTLGIGSGAAPWPDAPGGAASLPAGTTLIGAEVFFNGVQQTCSFSAAGMACDLPSLSRGDEVTATFTLQAGNEAVPNGQIWTSLKVAENVNDQGANRNTFFANSPISILPTSSNANGTFKGPDQALALGTAGQPSVPGDTQVTHLEVPGANGGVISVFETDGPTGCNPGCIGQTVSANVRDGEGLAPFLRWSLEINGIGAGINKGGILHENDNGTVEDIRYTNATTCSSATDVDCFESYVVNKKNNLTLMVFRTDTNGKVRAN
jgi:hypothetical protein